MGDNRARRLLRTVKRATYLVAVGPAVGRLPAALGYRLACWRGDWHFRCQAGKRTEMARNLRLVLGDELSPAAAQRVTREWFRLGCCAEVDLMRLRLRRGTRPQRRLIEIRGREHLEAALAKGKGSHSLQRPLWRLRQRFLGAACQRLPGHLHRAPVVQRRRPLIRRTMALGALLLEAGAALSAAADYRAMAWPAPGRGAGSTSRSAPMRW